MPVLNEDTFYLMHLLEQNDPLYRDCFCRAEEALRQFPPEKDRTRGISNIAANARAVLTEQLRDFIATTENTDIQDHLTTAIIDWRDVAREFIADVFSFHDDG